MFLKKSVVPISGVRSWVVILTKGLLWPIMNVMYVTWLTTMILVISNTQFSVTYHFTYIHNRPLQPFSQDYGLASHTTHVVCVNFMHYFSWQFYLLSEFLKKYFSYFIFLMTDLGYEPRLFASNKPTHHILDHGDFKH